MNVNPGAPDDSPVLVVVVNDPADLARARDDGWYWNPLDRAPRRIAADYLAFYQTSCSRQKSAGPCAGWRQSRSIGSLRAGS